MHADQDAAIANALVVVLDALLGHVPADQRADDAARGCACTGASDCRGQRPGDDKTEARYCQRGSNRNECRSNGANGAADCAANASAFRSLVAKLGFSASRCEIARLRVVGHHDIHVVAGIAAAMQGVEALLGACTVREQRGHQRSVFVHVASLVV